MNFDIWFSFKIIFLDKDFPHLFFQVVTKLSKLYPKDMEAPPGGVDDMTKLSYLHEPGVLANLRTRYELNEIYVCFLSLFCFWYSFYLFYCCLIMSIRICCSSMLQTYTGNILIAINPFQKLPHLYNQHMMQQYKGAPFGELSPHVFAVADVAYRLNLSFFWSVDDAML